MAVIAKKAQRGVVPAGLAERVLRGEQRALSRALSLIADGTEEGEDLAKAFFPYHGRSHKLGLCGPPGSGKSSLVSRFVTQLRQAQEKVGVLAVDPTSPFTGGAFLGDRLRVQAHALDPGVFMRSMATRGVLGGLPDTIFGAIHALEAYGCGRILVETVGTGQDEVDIAQVADTVLCVTAPYQGDEFQAMKAGIMEIADIFVVNKADLPEADRAVSFLKDALSLAGPSSAWAPRVAAVSAQTGQGVPELCALVEEHRGFLKDTPEGLARRKRQLRQELRLSILKRVARDAFGRISDSHIDKLFHKETDPMTLGKKLLSARGRGP